MRLKVYNDSSGKAVDWWFMYKLPKNIKPNQGSEQDFSKTTGWEYLYFDANSKGSLALSEKTLDQKNGALHKTLEQIYSADASSSDSLGWICYNDEIPGRKSNDSRKGHAKGLLAFDLETDSAFWLLHSWPRFPDIKTGELGSPLFAQTFMCIHLRNVDAARYIAEQKYHRHEPQTYQCRIPDSMGKHDIFYRVANAIDVNQGDPACDIHFFSHAWHRFRLMAKNRYWAKDFWIDHVGPHLQADIDVESWRRGTIPSMHDADAMHDTCDILQINLEKLGYPYQWHYTKDHAKWAVTAVPDWVCVADINRQTSQEKRGGGCICFRNKALWEALCEIELLVE